MINTGFPIRKDLYGLRYVFFMGNEGGNCKYNCTFCEIGKSNAVSSDYNISLFNNLFDDYLNKASTQKNHPLLYNRGNITDEKALSRKTLNAFWDVCIKVITPLVLIMLLINDLKTELSAPYEGYSWIAILMVGRDWLVIALIISLFIAMRPWKRELEEVEESK